MGSETGIAWWDKMQGPVDEPLVPPTRRWVHCAHGMTLGGGCIHCKNQGGMR